MNFYVKSAFAFLVVSLLAVCGCYSDHPSDEQTFACTPGNGDCGEDAECIKAGAFYVCSNNRSCPDGCIVPAACVNGTCQCFSSCEDKTCGDDSCGSSCGKCNEHYQCDDGTCVYQPYCADEICDTSLDETCESCPSDCSCVEGSVCYHAVCCTPDCDVNECGDDGCGGSCGSCSGCGETCESGMCVFTACVGRNCGTDTCGGTCGSCADTDVCNMGLCCTPACDVNECGDDGCGGSCGSCSGCGETCQSGKCVFSACYNKECGTDGCGGACGSCICGEECRSGQCVFTACDDRECGNDGCGGICGTCPSGQVCWPGRCEWAPLIDSTSGLEWYQPSGETVGSASAKSICSNLGLDGGGWRLPSIGELRTLIRGCPITEDGGICGVTDSCLTLACRASDGSNCGGCFYEPACLWLSGLHGECGTYWSSSKVDGNAGMWAVTFSTGSVDNVDSFYPDRYYRCVR